MDAMQVLAGDLIARKRELLQASSDEIVSDVLDELEREKLTSIAIYGRPGSWIGAGGVQLVLGHPSKQYIGIISILDIILFILNAESAKAATQCNISAVIGVSKESRSLWTETADKPLLLLMERFCKGTHHALVYDATNVFSSPRMLSQTDIVRFLYDSNSLELIPAVRQAFDEPINGILDLVKNVVHVFTDTPLREALTAIGAAYAMPVMAMGTDCRVVATLSASDFRGTSLEEVAVMAPMTVGEYLLYRHGGVLIPPPIIALPDETLKVVVQRMLVNKIHRIWIVRPTLEVVGVLSHTDIIRIAFVACGSLRGGCK